MSHVTQPLDIACFSPLKTAITSEIDAIFRNSVRRLLRVEWTSASILEGGSPVFLGRRKYR
jgi:hypothetical protein